MGLLATTRQTSFKGGILGRRARADTRSQRYAEGIAEGRNLTINVHGGLDARNPGQPVDDQGLLSADVRADEPGTGNIPPTTGAHGLGVTISSTGLGSSGLFAEFASANGDPIRGVRIAGLRQTPIIQSNEPFWHTTGPYVGPGNMEATREEDDRVLMRGTGVLRPAPTSSVRLVVNQLGNSLENSSDPWNTIRYINKYGLRLGHVRAKVSAFYIGEDGVPRLRFNHIGQEINKSKLSRPQGDRWFRDEPPVGGSELRRVYSGHTLYLYSREDHRGFVLPFKESEVESEHSEDREHAREDDEIILKWDADRTDVPFRYAYQLSRLTSALDYQYNWAIGEDGMTEEEVFPYPSRRYDIRATLGDREVVMSELPITTPVDVCLLPPPDSTRFRLDTDNVYSEPFSTGLVDQRFKFNTRYESIELFDVRDGLVTAADSRERKFSFIPWESPEDGVVLGLCTQRGILFFDRETGERLPGYVPFDREIDPRELRYARDVNAIIIAHPELEPMILRRLGKGVFGFAKLELEGIDQTEGKFMPAAVAFHDERLFFAGTKEALVDIYGSRSGNLRDFRYRTADATIPTSPFRFEIKDGVSRINAIVSQNRMAFTTRDALHFRDSSDSITPRNFSLGESTERGADPRSAPTTIRGRIVYQNAGLGEAILATYLNDNKGFEDQPFSLPNSDLFLNPENHDYAVGQWYDGSGELMYLFTGSGAGTLVATTILPGQNGFFGSTYWDFHRKYELRGRRLENREIELDRPVLGFWAGEGEVWVVLPNDDPGASPLEMRRVRTRDLVEPGEPGDGELVEVEFQSLPVLLPNNEGSGVPGGGFTRKRRIVKASCDMDGAYSGEHPAYMQVNSEWRPLTLPGWVRFEGLRGYGEEAQFTFRAISPVRLNVLELETRWTR